MSVTYVSAEGAQLRGKMLTGVFVRIQPQLLKVFCFNRKRLQFQNAVVSL